jgi:hypothetical protein
MHQFGWMLVYNSDREFKGLSLVSEKDVEALFDFCASNEPD